jgi:RNA polymerase sigma-70 factor (ECF subfamily)
LKRGAGAKTGFPFFTMTDAQLIQGCIDNDRRSQNELYRRYFPLMSSIALRYTGNEEEAIQKLNAGFLKVLQNLRRYDHQYALATFIRNILVNHLIDAYRKEKRYVANIDIAAYAESDLNVSFNQGEADLEAGELLELLNKLPELTCKVFNLYAIDGYKHSEIADMLDIPVGTSKWHVSEARRKLKSLLQEASESEKKRGKIAY